MAKKCIPGLFCIENMTLFFILVIILFLIFIYFNLKSTKYIFITPPSSTTTPISSPAIISQLSSVSTRNDPFNDPYSPPLKSDQLYYPRNSSDIRGIPPVVSGVPVNIKTQGYNMEYTQVGILTRTNAKLPVSLNGKSCTSETGCDEIYNNDTVFVEGYKDTFVATVYESGTFSYIPYV
jgi:hypothetical protein